MFGLDGLDPLRVDHTMDCGVACVPLLTALSTRRESAALLASMLALLVRVVLVLLVFRSRRTTPRRNLLPAWAAVLIPSLGMGVLLSRVALPDAIHAAGSAGTRFPECGSAQAADEVRDLWADYRAADGHVPPLVAIRNAGNDGTTSHAEACEADFVFGDRTERYGFRYDLEAGKMFLRAGRAD